MQATNSKIATCIAVGTGSLVLSVLIYKVLKKRNDDLLEEKKPARQRDTLIDLLQAFDEDGIEKSELINVLRRLSDISAFNSVQDQIRKLGYLSKVVNTLDYPDIDVQCQAALLVNNLSLNVENQSILKDCIPLLIQLLKINVINDSTVTLFTAILCALTNLTTLDGSHPVILPHTALLCELLIQCEIVQIKLQVLKIFVNISTNSKNCENDFELAARMLRSLEPFISPLEEHRFLLRSLTCCANILDALHGRWESGVQPHVTTPEFVSPRMHENLVRLSTHDSEEIRQHASKALKALRAPSSEDSQAGTKMDKLDLLDILKI